MMRIVCWTSVLGAAWLCLGCAAPQVAIDQANHGVRLTQELQNELARARQAMQASGERRIAVLRQDEQGVIANERERALNDYLEQASGRPLGWQASAKRLNEAHRKYAALLADEAKARQDLDDRLATVTRALPTPGEKLAAVQKALADLGTELTPQQRVEIVRRFAGDAKAIVDKNIQAASSAASAPAVGP